MPTMQSIIQIILIAIMSIGILSAGLMAVEESLNSYVAYKKEAEKDRCDVKVESQRVSNRITDKDLLDDIKIDCVDKSNKKINKDFETAFVYIRCFTAAFKEQENNSGSVSTSASSPACQAPTN